MDNREEATNQDEAAEFEKAFTDTMVSNGHIDAAAQEPAPATVEPEDTKPTVEEPENTAVDGGEPPSEGGAAAGSPEADSAPSTEDTDNTSGSGLPLSAFDEGTIKTLLAKSAKVDELEQLFEKQSHELRRAYGKIGELNSHIKQLMKNPTQRGIKQAELRFERLEAEFPEIAELLREDLASVLASAQDKADASETQTSDGVDVGAVGQTAQQTQTHTPEEVDAADAAVEDPFSQRELQLRMEYESKLLSMRHPDWQQVAQSPDFQIWLASQPPEVQQVARTSWSADELAPIFDLYKSASQALAAKAQATTTRQKRLETAVPVAESTSAAPPVADEVDEFLQGFESVMKRRLG